MSEALLRLKQITIEDQFDKKNIRSRVLAAFQESREQIESQLKEAKRLLINYFKKTYSYESKNVRVRQLAKSPRFSMDDFITHLMVTILPMHQATPFQLAVNGLEKYLNDYYHNDKDWAVKTASEILVVCCYSDLYDVIPARHSESGSIMLRSAYKLPESVLQAINDCKYLPPMVCKPNKVRRNYDSQYITRTFDHVILRKPNQHSFNQATDVINQLNEVPFSLDTRVLELAETSNKPLDTPEKIANFNRMVNSSNTVYEMLLEAGNQFYFPWKFDKRGRMYSQGYHCNIQGSEYKKALLNFTNAEVVNNG